jgi:hypothetical protein
MHGRHICSHKIQQLLLVSMIIMMTAEHRDSLDRLNHRASQVSSCDGNEAFCS